MKRVFPAPLLLSILALMFPAAFGLLGLEALFPPAGQGGRSIHTAIEWSSIVLTLAGAGLALASFRIEESRFKPAMGFAFLWAAAVQAIHALLSDGLLPVDPGSEEAATLSLAASRVFRGLCLPLAALLFSGPSPAPARWLVISNVVAGLGAWLCIQVSLAGPRAPAGLAGSPAWLLAGVPLALFVGLALPAFLLAHRRRQEVFTLLLCVGAAADILAQLPLVRPTPRPLEAHLYAAMASLFPLAGLVLDQLRAIRRAREAHEEARAAQSRSDRRAAGIEEDLERTRGAREALSTELDALKQAHGELTRAHAEVREAHRELQAEVTPGKLLEAPACGDSVSRIIADAAHDMKNPLAAITMGVDYLARQLPHKDRNVVMVLDEMKLAVGKTDSVIKGLVTDLQGLLPPGESPAGRLKEGDGRGHEGR